MRMRIIWLLVRAFFNGVKPIRTYFSRLSVSDRSKKGRTRVLQVVVTALLGISFVMLEGMVAVNYFTYQTLGVLLGIPHLGMFLAAFVGFSLLFLFGLIGLSSIIYRGKDISLVSTLPVTEVELLISRLLIAYLLYMPLYVVLVLPGIVVAGFLEGVDVLFVMGSLALLVFGPLLPLCLALLVAATLVRISKGKRFRIFEQFFTFAVMLGFYLIMITAFTRNMGDSSSFQVDYQSLMLSVGAIFSTLTRVFSLFMIQARMLWSWTVFVQQSLLLIVVSSVICLVVGRGFSRSLSLVASAQSRTRKKGKNRTYRVMSQTQSLIIREIEVIRGQSVFMFEVVGELLIPLILLGIYALTGVLGEIEGMAATVSSSPYLPYALVLGVLLISSLSMLSSTSVSRQGSQFALDKVLPISPRGIIKAKLVLHLILVGATDLVYLVLALLFFKLSLEHLLWMIPLTLLVVFAVASFGLAIDYKRPMLNWSIPQQAMKSNLNGVLGMLTSVGVLLVEAIVLFVPIFFLSSPAVGIVLSMLMAMGLCLLSWKICLRQASSAFSR